ncbi:MAG: hypothetical protein ACFFC6_12645 [Promethearchaeota archaeon]
MSNLETGVFLLFILLLAMIHTLGEVIYKKGSMLYVQSNLSIKDISKLSIIGFPLFIIIFSIGISLGIKVIYGIILASNPLSITAGLFLGSIAIFSVFFGKVFYNEQVSSLRVVGIGMIAFGIILLV